MQNVRLGSCVKDLVKEIAQIPLLICIYSYTSVFHKENRDKYAGERVFAMSVRAELRWQGQDRRVAAVSDSILYFLLLCIIGGCIRRHTILSGAV